MVPALIVPSIQELFWRHF